MQTGRSALFHINMFAFLVVILMMSAPHAKAQSREPVGLELALLIDVSASVSKEEYQLQLDGFAAAFSSKDIQEAVATSGGLVVCVIQWAQQAYQYKSVDWTVLNNSLDALKLATQIAAIPRQTPSGQTAIGDALTFAMNELETNRFSGLRRVIDVSGDGRANDGRPLRHAREEVLEKEITINALAIVNEFPDLKQYYRTQLIGGSGAFVLSARDYTDFARAISEKLKREIQALPVAKIAEPDPLIKAQAEIPQQP